MGSDMALRPLILFVLAFALGSLLATARGDDFRLETKVLAENSSVPLIETLTVFSGDIVYDFVIDEQANRIESKIVTVFDQRRGRIVMLDAQRKMQTTMTTEQLMDFTTAMRKRAGEERNGGLFNPEFTVTYEEAERRITMTSDDLTYRVTGETPTDATSAERYSRFADWYARLNAAWGNVPPFGRIELDRILAEKDLLPLEIVRTTVRDKKKSTVRSEHAANWTLSNTDRRRIDYADQLMASLREVSLKEFWGVRTEATAKK